MIALDCPSARPRRPGFTLVELLVVMGVIAMLSVLTLISVRAMSGGARMALATNTVTSTLENARALAIRESAYTMVAFRPVIRSDGTLVIQAVTARWSGESPPAAWGSATNFVGVDRYVPVPDAPVRELEKGINVAGPNYEGVNRATEDDDAWITQPDLRLTQTGGEPPGPMLAVLYGPNGSVVTGNPESDALRIWVDFNDDHVQTIAGTTLDYDAGVGTIDQDDFFNTYALMSLPDEEPYVSVVPFIAVFDSDAAREAMGDSDWGDYNVREAELTAYIDKNATPIYFNRYTGVAMR